MKRAQFDQLDKMEQAEVLRSQGTLLARRKPGNLLVFLYQVNNFYVEVYFHISVNQNFYSFQGLNSFEDTEQLEPYLHAIDLSPVV